MRRLVLLGLVSLLLVAAGACGEDDGAGVREIGEGAATGSESGSVTGSGTGSAAAAACVPVGDATTSDETVEVVLDEWAIVASPGTVGAGRVTFRTDNAGEEVHELVVVRADDPDELPVEDGLVVEDALPAGSFIGEIEGFPADESCEGTFELPAADYVLFCNIVETEPDGTLESHFEEGMRTEFSVS